MPLLNDNEHLHIRPGETHIEFEIERRGPDPLDRRYESVDMPIHSLLSVALAKRMPESLETLIDTLRQKAKANLM